MIVAHGAFWRSRPELPPAASVGADPVDIVVPARDEAITIGAALGSLLRQDHGGALRIILVDDGSSDATCVVAQAAVAHAAAEKARAAAGATPPRAFLLVPGTPKPPGWSGKLWAVEQGVRCATAPLLLLTDADIVHDPRHLSSLLARLAHPRVDLVSEMVRLRCSSAAERSLVPAFVYFFQMLYPFARVNDPHSAVAAAAGGTLLLRRAALDRIGGIGAIKGALIDDVALARALKPGGAIYLGHSRLAESIREYPRFGDVWSMIARTAFTQLHHSALLLGATLFGLTLVWLVPPWAACMGHGWARACGAVAYGLGAASFLPTLARYRRSPAWSLALPAIALFYMAATLGSAVDHWRGAGARWKSRNYPA